MLLECFLEQIHDQIGVVVRGAEDDRLPRQTRVDLLREFGTDDAVEIFRQHPLVELVDFDLNFVGSGFRIDLTGEWQERLNRVAFLPGDSVFAERGDDADRRFVIDQPAVDDRPAIAVGVDRRAEDLNRMQRGRCRQADLHRVEVVDDAAVLADVVGLVAEGQLGIAQLFVERVPTVAFVHDDAIVRIDGKRDGVLSGEEQSLDHALHGGNLEFRIVVRGEIAEFLHIVNIGKGEVRVELHVLQGVLRLLAERGAIHEKKDAAESASFDEPIDQGNTGSRFAGARRHRHEQFAHPFHQPAFDGFDGVDLIIPQRQERWRLVHQLAVRRCRVLGEQLGQAGGAVPAFERSSEIRRFAGIDEPDTRLGLNLPEERPAVRREAERHAVFAPRPCQGLVAQRSVIAAVAFSLLD